MSHDIVYDALLTKVSSEYHMTFQISLNFLTKLATIYTIVKRNPALGYVKDEKVLMDFLLANKKAHVREVLEYIVVRPVVTQPIGNVGEKGNLTLETPCRDLASFLKEEVTTFQVVKPVSNETIVCSPDEQKAKVNGLQKEVKLPDSEVSNDGPQELDEPLTSDQNPESLPLATMVKELVISNKDEDGIVQASKSKNIFLVSKVHMHFKSEIERYETLYFYAKYALKRAKTLEQSAKQAQKLGTYSATLENLRVRQETFALLVKRFHDPLYWIIWAYISKLFVSDTLRKNKEGFFFDEGGTPNS